MRRPAVLLCLAALIGFAPTGQAAPPAPMDERAQARQCFYPSQVTNFRSGETQSVFIRVLNRNVYELSSGGCTDLNSTSTLSITSEFGSVSRLCVGDSVRLITAGPSLVNRPCRARITRQLTEAEVEALPSRQKP